MWWYQPVPHSLTSRACMPCACKVASTAYVVLDFTEATAHIRTTLYYVGWCRYNFYHIPILDVAAYRSWWPAAQVTHMLTQPLQLTADHVHSTASTCPTYCNGAMTKNNACLDLSRCPTCYSVTHILCLLGPIHDFSPRTRHLPTLLGSLSMGRNHLKTPQVTGGTVQVSSS